MSCLSILRYITDHLKHLPLSIISFILNEKDMMLLLI